jgi:hypothetical protein
MKSAAYSPLVLAVCLIAVGFNFVTPSDAQEQSAPPLVKQINNGNWLSQQEAEALRDELFYERAVYAYQTSTASGCSPFTTRSTSLNRIHSTVSRSAPRASR